MDPIPSKFERYTDPTGERMTNRDLQVASWVVRHRVLMRKLGIGTLSVVSGVLCIYGIAGLLYYALFGLSEDNIAAREMVASTANYAALQSRYGASELRILSADAYEASAGRFDFVATLVNDNARWAAVVRYRFTHSQGESDSGEAIILPQTERPVIISGEKLDDIPRAITFEITNIEWKHIDTHSIADIEEYTNERRNFAFDTMVFVPQSAVDNIPSNILQFTFHNKSAFSYWDVPLIVELFENGSRVGIAQTKVEKLKAGDSRTLDLRTLTPNISVTDIRVHPTVNIFDSRVFMAPEVD